MWTRPSGFSRPPPGARPAGAPGGRPCPASGRLSPGGLCRASFRVKALPDGLDLVPQALVFLELVGDLLDRVQRRGVVATAERVADHRQRRGRLLADYVHRDLAGEDDVLVAAL